MDASGPTSLWSEEVGSTAGPLVVLVHGSMDRAAGVVRLARYLRDVARVIIYDRRGYGRSLAAGPPFTIARHADDLTELIGGRTAYLFGHSMGGNVALATAARHPECVLGVLTYESPVSWMSWWPRTPGSAAVELEPGDAAEEFLRQVIGSDRWDALPAKVKASRRAEGPALVGELVDVRERAPFAVADITVPVVVVRGERASDAHVRSADALAGLFGQVPMVLPEAGHGAPASHAEALGALIREELLVSP